eukprot:TRINITY_DN50970_c0_g1_i1.p1 TRINITY_DN50970_c0_g1~~TRINITY_DN50970_c0_g1_i1.p1  ORF type:complete len:197 (+),score=36.79 TRINITY_DN50970_c0_g1_i1:96-686(+)
MITAARGGAARAGPRPGGRRCCAGVPDAIVDGDGPNPFRPEIRELYRRLLRIANMMPTKNRREFMMAKVRQDFRRDPHLRDEAELSERVALARAQVDSAEVQARHLTMWLGGRDDAPAAGPELGPEAPDLGTLPPDGYGYEWKREWDSWLRHHPRYCPPEDAGTPLGIERWQKLVRNKRARQSLLPAPPNSTGTAR